MTTPHPTGEQVKAEFVQAAKAAGWWVSYVRDNRGNPEGAPDIEIHQEMHPGLPPVQWRIECKSRHERLKPEQLRVGRNLTAMGRDGGVIYVVCRVGGKIYPEEAEVGLCVLPPADVALGLGWLAVARGLAAETGAQDAAGRQEGGYSQTGGPWPPGATSSQGADLSQLLPVARKRAEAALREDALRRAERS